MKAQFGALAVLATSVTAATVGRIQKRATTPITVKGNAFFAGDERFYVRGVDYQPGGSSNIADPIADTAGCLRDLETFRELGLNSIRVYTVDNSANHDECMNALADAGIYLILDVNSPLYSLNRKDPQTSYNAVYLQNIFATIDIFAQYDNTMAFFSGNEVVDDGPSSVTAPYVKAVTRDMRQYLGSRGYRQVPVGYSAADVNTNRLEMAQYMNCGTDDERSDFFAFNDYSWCDPSSYTISGWDQKVENFTGYGLPLFLSEYGCNTNTREFKEVEALYGEQMSAVYSGGLVYEFSQEPSNYGLIEINGGTTQELPDFSALRDALRATPNPSGDGGYNSTGGPSGCPERNAPNWDVDSNLLPAIPDEAKKYMTEGAGPGVGFAGEGSQTAGGQSPGLADPGSGAVDGNGSPKKPNAAASLTISKESTYTGLLCAIVTFITFFGTTML